MIEPDSPSVPLPKPEPRRWPRVVLMVVIFLSGTVVGGVVARIVTREQILAMLKHPERVPDRILPHLRTSLGLTSEQAQRVNEIVRRRHATMESLRARSYPGLLVEFHAMRDEVKEVLSSEQQARWTRLSESIERRYLPDAPSVQP